MKHLPNLLTLANLFCGCVAIAYILNAQPYLVTNMDTGMPSWVWVRAEQQICIGSIFIGIAAVCDMLDGLAARALNAFSPIGKDLDSLADVVSFGVAPSMILFKFLWDALMGEKNAFDASLLGMVPAFLLACFAALRLAKFNITAASQKQYFIGMPTPAVGLFVASLPLLTWYNPYEVSHLFQNKWFIYLIIAVLCFLMVSRIKFFKMIPAKKGLKYMWPQITLVVVTLAAIPFLYYATITFAFLVYILLSIVYRQPEEETAQA